MKWNKEIIDISDNLVPKNKNKGCSKINIKKKGARPLSYISVLH
jgi:hypothetical protein